MGDADNTSNRVLTEFNKKVGILSTHQFSTTPDEIAAYISNDTVGDATEIKNQMDAIFLENVDGYVKDTFNGIMLNNVGNTNGYLRTNLSREHENAQKLYRNITSQIHKARLGLLEKEYSIHYNRFLSMLYQITALVVVLSFILVKAVLDDYISLVLSIILIIIIVVIYILFLVVVLRRNSRRNSYKWDKFYFDLKPKKSNSKN